MNTTIQLLTDIETALGKKLQTPKDFDFLRERIYARLHILVSRTTLMRIWGYIAPDFGNFSQKSIFPTRGI